jgi:2,4-dienoyl-CoA reductase-like NADH-dependent reductase (Old Yellow Enzyme family)
MRDLSLAFVGSIPHHHTMLTPEDLCERIERHLAETGTKPSAFGRQVANDPHLVRDLKEGREPRRKTVERIMAALSEPAEASA